MKGELTDADRQHLRQLQKKQRDDAGYVKVTVVLLLYKICLAASIADDLGLDEATFYRYTQAWRQVSWERCLVHDAVTYWGLLWLAGLASLSREVEQTSYTDVQVLGQWLQCYWGARYSHSGLTQLLPRLGFVYKLTMPVPCKADSERQVVLLAEQLLPLLAQAQAGQAMVYFADAAHPQYPLDSGLDSYRVAPAHCQWPQAREPECGAQRPLSHSGARESYKLR